VDQFPKFIMFTQQDPNYKGSPGRAAVAAGQIVKIEPLYYVEQDGKKFLAYVGTPSADDIANGVQRIYRVYDSLGGVYTSDGISEEARQLIENLFRSAV
jgi:hypothetical protein